MQSLTASEIKRLLSTGDLSQRLQSFTNSLTTGENVEQRLRADEVVITGVSGRFGEYENVEEWSRDLYQQEEQPQQQQQQNMDRLSEQFKLKIGLMANVEPQFEQILKTVWQTIIDANMKAYELKTTRTGVFVGVSGGVQPNKQQSLYPTIETTTTKKVTLASRIAQHFDFKGPSQVYEVTRPQSLIALDSAVHAIRTGVCDYAIVAGVTYPFEQSTEQPTVGVVFLQRKSDVKRNYYAKVLHSKVQMDGGRGVEQQQTHEHMTRFIQDAYLESKIDVSQVNYVELHGQHDTNEIQLVRDAFKTMRSANKQQLHIGSTKWNVGRLQSPTGIFNLIKVLVSIQRGQLPANIFQREQERELIAQQPWIKIADVNTKLTDGLIALSSMNRGEAYVHTIIEPNQQYNNMQQQLEQQTVDWSLRQARQQEALEWAAKHAKQQETLEWATRQSKQMEELDQATRQLRLQEPLEWAARQAKLQENVLDWNNKNNKQHQQQADNIKKSKTFAELFEDRLQRFQREYQQPQQQQENDFLPNYESLTSAKSFPTLTRQQLKNDENNKRPIWFLIADIGAHWRGSIKDLLEVEQFRYSMQKSADYLKPYGIDLMQLVQQTDKRPFNNNNNNEDEQRILNTSVIVPAIQIALVDLLKQLNVVPDGIVGYSFGEFVAAYVDKALTHEEALLAAYYKGKIIEEANFQMSSVVLVGCTWDEAKRMTTASIVPAYYIAKDLVAFTGPCAAVQRFAEELKKNDIYTQIVESLNVPLHSHQMAPIVSKYQSALDKIIRSPKQRSPKWLSTTLLEYKYESYASAEYFVHNIVSAVHLYEVIKRIPANAVTVEIGPQYFLKPYLMQTLGDKAMYVNLMRHDNRQDIQLEYLLRNLSNVSGENVQASWFKVRQTAEHFENEDNEYTIPKFIGKPQQQQQQDKPRTQYGYKVDGKMVYPVSGYLQLVRDTLESQRKFNQDKQSVAFENVEFYYPVDIKSQQQVKFQVELRDTGKFEIMENGRTCVGGYVYVLEDEDENDDETSSIRSRPVQETTVLDSRRMDVLGQDEVYILLAQKGYEYAPEWQQLRFATPEGTRGELEWSGKWVPSIEALIQMKQMSQPRAQYPSYIRSVIIDPRKHAKSLQRYDANKKNVEQSWMTGVLPVVYEPITKTISAGGIDLQDLQFEQVIGQQQPEQPQQQQQQQKPTQEQQPMFVPYFEKYQQTTTEAGRFDRYIDEINHNIAKINKKVQLGSTLNQVFPRRPLFESFGKQTTMQQQLHKPTSVLQLVHEAANTWTIEEILSNLVDQLHMVYSQDVILNGVYDSNLKSTLEIVLENQTQHTDVVEQPKKLRILEVSPALHFTGSKLVKTLQEMQVDNDKVELWYSSVGDVSEQVWSEFERTARVPISRVDWNMLLTNQLSIQFDLVLFNGSLATVPFGDNKVLFKKWLATFVEKMIKPHGFFMINEYVNNFELYSNLQRLEMLSKKNEQITYGFKSEQEWRSMFEESTGLYPVAIKSNPTLSTLFLYRRQNVPTQAYPGSGIQRPVTKEAELYVNDFESLIWLEKTKQIINDSTIERVWIISETMPSPRVIMAIVKFLRAQPKFNHLRFVFVADADKNNGQPMNVFYDNISFNRADLVMNVYKNGKWGTLSKYQQESNINKPIDISSIASKATSLKETIHSLSTLRELIKSEIARRQQFSLKTSEPTTPVDEQMEKRFASLPTTRSTTDIEINNNKQEQGLNFYQLHAHHTLITRGGLKPTDTVLIHGGYSQLGQYAIKVALEHASQVFVTVKNLDELKKLEKQFAQFQLQVQQRSVMFVTLMSEFERTIMQLTEGKGVDVVFNNIDERLQASFNVLNVNGRFLDIEQHKRTDNDKLQKSASAWELPMINKSISYIPVPVYTPVGQTSTKYQRTESQENDKYKMFLELRQEYLPQPQQQQQSARFNLMPKRILEKLNEFEGRQQTTPVVIVHSIEGHANMLKSLAKSMKFPVYGLQFTQEALKHESVQQLAEFYVQQIEKEFPAAIGVHLIGYGFGGLVAVEMASRRPSRFETLSFLDGPSRHQQQQWNKLNNKTVYQTEAQQESEWLWSFVSQYNTTLVKSYKQQHFVQLLSAMPTLEQRVKYVVENFLLTSQFQFEQTDAENAARAYIAKLKMAKKYQPLRELCFDEVLIVKPAQRGSVEVYQEDFDLTGVFNGRVHVQIIDGDNRTFLESTSGQQVARLFNEYLAQY